MNIRKRMMEQTASLSMDSFDVEEATPAEVTEQRPKTAVGTMAALSAAQIRIKELEEKGAQTAIPVAKIRRNPWQPRKEFNEAKLRELADNIKEVGLLQPVLVRRSKSADGQEEGFELIAGERRFRAHQLNGYDEIKALVTEASDADMAVMALTENISREDLSDYEIGIALRRAESEFPDRKRMAEAMGLSRSQLYRYLAFDSLPDFMLADLDKSPGLLGGSSASDTHAVLKKYGQAGVDTARALWPQVLSGQIDQYRFSQILEAALLRKAGAPATTKRDILKVYSGKTQAGSITRDEVSLTVKLKAAVVTAEQEERIRALITELFNDKPPA